MICSDLKSILGDLIKSHWSKPIGSWNSDLIVDTLFCVLPDVNCIFNEWILKEEP